MHKSFKEQFLLLKLKMNRDPEAFGALYDLYVDRIYRFVYFKVSSQEIAEDITADVFLRAWEYVVKNSVDNFNALLYQIARNLVIDHYRKSGREQPLERQDETGNWKSEIENLANDTSYLSSVTDTESDIDLSIDIEFLKQCLPQLRSDYHEIIVLRFIEELNIGEIADILEKEKGHIRVLIHRAIKEFRIIVEREQTKLSNKSQITNSRQITNYKDANK